MDSSRYLAFLYAAESGSFSKAADLLNYTPSGVSQLVSALEDELSLQLLSRNKKGVKLTDEGKQLLPLIRTYIEQENLIKQTASEINGLIKGSLRIASYPSIAIHWLPAVLKAFSKDYPSVEIRMMEGIRAEICQWLDEGKANLALMGYQEGMPYEWIPLAEDPLLAILPVDHPMAKEEKFPISACVNEPFVIAGLGIDPELNSLFEKNKINPDVHYMTIENFSALSLVEQGLGMSIMNELITLGSDRKVIKIPLDPPEHLSLGISLPSFDKAPPVVRRFIEYAVIYLTQAEKNV